MLIPFLSDAYSQDPFLSDAYSQDIHEHDDIFNQIKAQLNITDEQNENFELIINEYLQKQTNIFKKYNINPNSLNSSRKQINLAQLRAIKNDMDKIHQQTERKLVKILTKEQFKIFKIIQEEQRNQLRLKLMENRGK